MFEYWGHEASLLPVELYPLLRWRMDGDHAWGGMVTVATRKPDLLDQLREAVRDQGPVTLAELEHLGDAIKRGKAAPGNMWNWSDAKKAVEWLFWRGEVSAVRNPATFGRHYVSPERVLPAEVREAPVPSDDDAMKAPAHAGRAQPRRRHGPLPGRLPPPEHRDVAPAAGRAGRRRRPAGGRRWRAGATPPTCTRRRSCPRWVRASALLSPFDSLVWQRERTEALFDFRYRIEIYVPAAQRVHGYYVLPFLHDGRLVARLDLKADRQAGTLRVRAAHAEPTFDDDKDLPALQARLEELATLPRPGRRRGRAARATSPHPPSSVVAYARIAGVSDHRARQSWVRTSQPSAVTTRVCSNWAVRRRSTVTAVHPSSQRSCSHAPTVIIGSIVKVMPSSITRVRRGS